jgi:hypothetical protein
MTRILLEILVHGPKYDEYDGERLTAPRGGGAAVKCEEVPSAESLLNSGRHKYTPTSALANVKKYSQRIGRSKPKIDERDLHRKSPRFRETNPRQRLFEKRVVKKNLTPPSATSARLS